MPVNKEGDMGAEKFYHADVHVSFGKPISVPKKIGMKININIMIGSWSIL